MGTCKICHLLDEKAHSRRPTAGAIRRAQRLSRAARESLLAKEQLFERANENNNNNNNISINISLNKRLEKTINKVAAARSGPEAGGQQLSRGPLVCLARAIPSPAPRLIVFRWARPARV